MRSIARIGCLLAIETRRQTAKWLEASSPMLETLSFPTRFFRVLSWFFALTAMRSIGQLNETSMQLPLLTPP